MVRSNLNSTHNYVTDQTAQGSQEQVEGFLNAKQPLLLKQMLAAPPLISENPTQHIQHEPQLTSLSPTTQELNNHVTNLIIFVVVIVVVVVVATFICNYGVASAIKIIIKTERETN